ICGSLRRVASRAAATDGTQAARGAVARGDLPASRRIAGRTDRAGRECLIRSEVGGRNDTGPANAGPVLVPGSCCLHRGRRSGRLLGRLATTLGRLAGTLLGSLPLGGLPLRGAALGGLALGGLPLRSAALGGLALGGLPLRSLPLGRLLLRTAPLRSLPLRGLAAGPLLVRAPLRGLPLCSLLPDCHRASLRR